MFENRYLDFNRIFGQDGNRMMSANISVLGKTVQWLTSKAVIRFGNEINHYGSKIFAAGQGCADLQS